MTKKLWIANLMMGALSVLCLGSGTGQYEYGVAGLGNGGAFVARAEDGSAIYYNPAGLVQLETSELAINAQSLFSKSFYSNVGQSTWDSEAASEALPNLYFNLTRERFAFGFAANTTFQYQVEWEDADFPGRFRSTGSETLVREYAGAIAFKLSDSFSVGATVRFAQADYEWGNVLNRPLPDTSLFYETHQRVETDGDEVGFIVGMQYFQGRRFSIGASYQSGIDFDLEGSREYALASRLDDQRVINDFNANFAPTQVGTTFSVPERFAVGVNTRITVRTRLEFDFTYERWSAVDRQVFDSDGALTVINRDWDDVYSFRVAGDFQQKKALVWRMGIGTYRRVAPDETLDPSFPDSDRFYYSFGVSYSFRSWTVEGGYMYTQSRDRNTFEQDYAVSNNPPDYVMLTGEEGIFETQRHQIKIGLKKSF